MLVQVGGKPADDRSGEESEPVVGQRARVEFLDAHGLDGFSEIVPAERAFFPKGIGGDEIPFGAQRCVAFPRLDGNHGFLGDDADPRLLDGRGDFLENGDGGLGFLAGSIFPEELAFDHLVRGDDLLLARFRSHDERGCGYCFAGLDGNLLAAEIGKEPVGDPRRRHGHGLIDRLERGGDHPEQRDQENRRAADQQDVDGEL